MDTNDKMVIGFAADGSPIELPVDALARHVLAVGSSGSGKTGMMKVIVEEAVRRRIPAIIVDPQGDMAALGLRNKDAQADKDIADDYFSQIDLKVWTPGSSAGIPLSLAPSINTKEIKDPEEKIRVFGDVSKVVAALVGCEVGSEAGQTAALAFFTILEYADKLELACETVEDFILFLQDPPADLARDMDSFFDNKARASMAKKLLVRTSGPNKLLFQMGYSICIDTLLGYEEGGAYSQGKTRVSVIYLNTLSNDADKEVFIAMLANALYTRMLQQPSKKVQALFYVEEAAPYCPATNKKQPVCKEPLMKLLRQARKYGIGCLIATQSPGDLDYKGLGQFGAWIIGNLKTDQDREKVASALQSDQSHNSDELIRQVAKLKQREFVITAPDAIGPEPLWFQSRFMVTEHQTLDVQAVKSITSQADRHVYGGLPL